MVPCQVTDNFSREPQRWLCWPTCSQRGPHDSPPPQAYQVLETQLGAEHLSSPPWKGHVPSPWVPDTKLQIWQCQGDSPPLGNLGQSTGLAGVTGHLWLTLVWGTKLGGGFFLEGQAGSLVCLVTDGCRPQETKT